MKRERVPAAVPRREHLLQDLADPAFAAAYLNAAVRESDVAAFLQALRNVVDASGGVAKLAARADLNRQALYRMLSEDGNPELKSLQSLLSAAGLGLSVEVSEPVASYRVRRGGKKNKRRHPRTEALKRAA
jgi:probable addiction module antidote protein